MGWWSQNGTPTHQGGERHGKVLSSARFSPRRLKWKEKYIKQINF